MKEKIIAYLRPLFFRTFDIREGEFVRARLMLIQIFLIISSLLVIKPAINAMFLANFGARQLPVAFILVALSAAVVSFLYSRILNKLPLNKIIIRTIWASTFSFIVFGILLKLNFLVGGVLYVFYIWIAIFGVLSASQFWILANLVFNSREAKRLFGFIGAGAIAGGIFGGYFATLLASLVGSENLVFGGAFLLALSIPVTRKIWKLHVSRDETERDSTIKVQESGKNPIRLILGSRHLTYMALIIAVSVIVAKLVEYQYSAIAAARIKNPDDLTAFFGFWFSNFSVLSLLIQLFLTRRVVGVFGVGISLFFLPLGIMVGAVILVFFPELWAAILIKMVDGSLKQSINKSANELLALPIPSDIKKHTKSFIDIFVDSAATGVGGLILLFVVTGLNLSTVFVSIIIFLLLVLWIYLAVKVRREYMKQFKAKIIEFQGAHGYPLNEIESLSILDSIKEVFKNGSEDQIIYMLKKVIEIRDERLIENIFELVKHDSPKVRLEALRNLYFLNSINYSEELSHLTGDPDEQVRIATFEYLTGHITVERIEELTTYLEHPDSDIRQAALIALATESKGNTELQKKLGLLEIIKDKRKKVEMLDLPEKAIKTKKVVLRAIGAGQIVSLYDYITLNLESSNKQLVLTAIESAGYTIDPIFVKPLFRLLDDKNYRSVALIALSGYDSILFEYIPDNQDEMESWGEKITLIPQVLELIDSQRSVDYLFNLLENNHKEAAEQSLLALDGLKSKFKHLKFSDKKVKSKIHKEAIIFHDALTVLSQEHYNQSGILVSGDGTDGEHEFIPLNDNDIRKCLNRIFRLLGIIYDPEEMLGVFNAICSDAEETRLNAIEFLDALLDPGIKRLVIPIVEAALSEKLSKEIIRSVDFSKVDIRSLFR